MIKIQIIPLLFVLIIYIQSIYGENINKFITIPYNNSNNHKSLNDYFISNAKIKLIKNNNNDQQQQQQQQYSTDELILNTDEFGSIDYDSLLYTPKYLILQDTINNIKIYNGTTTTGKLIEFDIVFNQQENQFNLNNYNDSIILIFKELQQIISKINPILSNFNSSFVIPFINTEIMESTTIINELVNYPINLNSDMGSINQKLTNIISDVIFRELKPNLFKVYSSYGELLNEESKSFIKGVINFLSHKIFNISFLNLSTNDNEQQTDINDLDNNIKLFLKDYSLLGNGNEISKLFNSIGNIDVLDFNSFIIKLRTLHNNDDELSNILTANNLCDGGCFGDSGGGVKKHAKSSFLKATGDPVPLTDRKRYSGVITRDMYIKADQHHPLGKASCIFQNEANQRYYDLSNLRKPNGESYSVDSKTFYILNFNLCGNNATTKCQKEVQSCQEQPQPNGGSTFVDTGISVLNDIEYFETGLTIQYSSNLRVCATTNYRISNYVFKCDPTVTIVIDKVEEIVICRYDVYIRTKFACPIPNKYLDPINHNVFDQRPLVLSPTINPYTVPLTKNDVNPSTFYFNIGGKTNGCRSVTGSSAVTYGCRVLKFGTAPIILYTSPPIFKIESSSSVSYSFSKAIGANTLPGCTSLVSTVKLTLTCDIKEFFKITNVSSNACNMDVFAISMHSCPSNKYIDSFNQVFDLAPLIKMKDGYMVQETYLETAQINFNFGVTPTNCLSSISNSLTSTYMHNCFLTKTTLNPTNRLYQFGNYQKYIADSSKMKSNITLFYSSLPIPYSVSTSTCYSDELIISLNCDYTTNFSVSLPSSPFKCTHVALIKSKFICDGFSNLYYVKSLDSFIDLKINGPLTFSFTKTGRVVNLSFGGSTNPCIIGGVYYQGCIGTTVGLSKSAVIRENGITFNYLNPTKLYSVIAIFNCVESTTYSLVSAVDTVKMTTMLTLQYEYLITINSKYACPRSYLNTYQPSEINNPDPCIIECSTLTRTPTPTLNSISDMLIKSGVCSDQINQYTDIQLESMVSNLWVNNKNVSSSNWSTGQFNKYILSAANRTVTIKSISRFTTISDLNKCIYNPTITKSFDNLITISNQIKTIHGQSSFVYYSDGIGGSLSYKNITLATGLVTIFYNYKICAVFETTLIKISPVIASDIFSYCPMFQNNLISIVPSIASAGEIVRINGNFLISNSFSVYFGTKLATIIEKKNDFIRVTVPIGVNQCDASVYVRNIINSEASNSLPFIYKAQVCTTTRTPTPTLNSISDVLIKGGVCPNQISQFTDIQLETAISKLWIDNIVSGDGGNWTASQFYKYIVVNQSSSIGLYGKYYESLSSLNKCIYNVNYNKTYNDIISISNDFGRYGSTSTTRRIVVRRMATSPSVLGLNTVYLDGKICSVSESTYNFAKILTSCPYTNCTFTCYDITQQEFNDMPDGSLNKTLLSMGICPYQINQYNYTELVEYISDRWVVNPIPGDWKSGQFYYYFKPVSVSTHLSTLVRYNNYTLSNFCTYYSGKARHSLDDILQITSDLFILINKQVENNATRIKYNSMDTYFIPLPLEGGGVNPNIGLSIVLVDLKLCSFVHSTKADFDNGKILSSCPIGPIVYSVSNPLSSIVQTPFQYSITVHGRKLEGSIITIGDDNDVCDLIGISTDPFTLLQNLTCILPVSQFSNFENKQIQFTNEYSKLITSQVLPPSNFHFNYPTPIITDIIFSNGNKSNVKYQETITIKGSNFFSTSNSWDKIVVEIDDIDVSYTKSNPTPSLIIGGLDSFEVKAIGISTTNTIYIKYLNDNNVDVPLEFKSFSFEKPIITRLSSTSGNVGDLITVYGNNFANNSVDVRFSSEVALISEYVSQEEVVVIVPGGYLSVDVVVIVGDQTSDDSIKFDFPNPIIDKILHRDLLNTSITNKFWIVGRGLGSSVSNYLDFKVQDFSVNCEISYCDESNDETPTPTPTTTTTTVEDVTQDVNYCPLLKSTYQYYYSTYYDLYICEFPFSVGKNISFSIPLENNPTPFTHKYSFHVPMITELSTNSSGTNGGNCTNSFNCKDPNDKPQQLNITGFNYIPTENLSPYFENSNIIQQWNQDSLVSIGDYQCKNVTWLSSFDITCEIPPGLGKDLYVTVKVNGQQSAPLNAKESKFSYKQPELDTGKRYSSPVQGGKTITIIGNQFVPKDLISKVDSRNGSVSINNVKCTNWDWINVNKVSCTVPAGTGKKLDVKVVVANQETLFNTLFSYIEDNDKERPVINILIGLIGLLIAGVAATLAFLTFAILETIKQASLFALSTTLSTALTTLQSTAYTAGAVATVTKKIVMNIGKDTVKKITAIGWTYMVSSKVGVPIPLLLSSPLNALSSVSTNNGLQLINNTTSSSLFNYDTYSFNIDNPNNSKMQCKDSNGLLKNFNSSLSCEMDFNSLAINCIHMNVNWTFYQTISCEIDKTKSVVFTHPPITTSPTPSTFGYLHSYYNDLDNYLIIYNEKSQVTLTDGTKKIYFPMNSTIYCSSSTIFNNVIDCFTDTDLTVHSFNNDYISYFINNYGTYYYISTPPINPITPVVPNVYTACYEDDEFNQGGSGSGDFQIPTSELSQSDLQTGNDLQCESGDSEYYHTYLNSITCYNNSSGTINYNDFINYQAQTRVKICVTPLSS